MFTKKQLDGYLNAHPMVDDIGRNDTNLFAQIAFELSERNRISEEQFKAKEKWVKRFLKAIGEEEDAK